MSCDSCNAVETVTALYYKYLELFTCKHSVALTLCMYLPADENFCAQHRSLQPYIPFTRRQVIHKDAVTMVNLDSSIMQANFLYKSQN